MLDVEAYRGNGLEKKRSAFSLIQMECQQKTYSYDFAYLKPVENGRLSSAVESQDQDSHLARADEASKVTDKSTYKRRKLFLI